jgi:hypothetical protein
MAYHRNQSKNKILVRNEINDAPTMVSNNITALSEMSAPMFQPTKNWRCVHLGTPVEFTYA